MRKYFDFNSTRPKSLFEGIDLDDETEDIEDVQFEKPAIQNDFKEEQFRIMTAGLLNAIPYYVEFEEEHCFGSYIKDGQKHYTYVFQFLNRGYYNPYMFDYCFETNNLIIWSCESAPYNIRLYCLITKIISECEFPINIYYGTSKCEDDKSFLTIASSIPNVFKKAVDLQVDTSTSLAPQDAIRTIPHKFFDKFKGFIFDFEDPIDGMDRTIGGLDGTIYFRVRNERVGNKRLRNERNILVNMIQNRITDY